MAPRGFGGKVLGPIWSERGEERTGFVGVGGRKYWSRYGGYPMVGAMDCFFGCSSSYFALVQIPYSHALHACGGLQKNPLMSDDNKRRFLWVCKMVWF